MWSSLIASECVMAFLGGIIAFQFFDPTKANQSLDHLVYFTVGWIGVMAVWGCWLLYKLLSGRGFRIWIYPLALVTEDRHGGRLACRWSDMRDLQVDHHHADSGRLLSTDYTITANNGTQFKFSAYGMDVPILWEVHDAIRDQFNRARLAPHLEQVMVGEGLTFGHWRLSSEGLHQGKEVLRWSEIQRIEADEDQLTVARGNGANAWSAHLGAKEKPLAEFLIRELTRLHHG